MILGFKPQFKELIISGSKIHTIRESNKRNWRRGKMIHMATGVRTKNYNCFSKIACSGVQRVFMSLDTGDELNVSINSKELFGHHEREQFAKNDGFDNWEAFEDWFSPILEKNEDRVFSGIVIHWTEFRY